METDCETLQTDCQTRKLWRRIVKLWRGKSKLYGWMVKTLKNDETRNVKLCRRIVKLRGRIVKLWSCDSIKTDCATGLRNYEDGL